MTAKVSVFIATSLDGFIARPDGGIDWLDRAHAVVPSGEDCGYKSLYAYPFGFVQSKYRVLKKI